MDIDLHSNVFWYNVNSSTDMLEGLGILWGLNEDNWYVASPILNPGLAMEAMWLSWAGLWEFFIYAPFYRIWTHVSGAPCLQIYNCNATFCSTELKFLMFFKEQRSGDLSHFSPPPGRAKIWISLITFNALLISNNTNSLPNFKSAFTYSDGTLPRIFKINFKASK